MEISYSQLSEEDGNIEFYFEQNGQIIGENAKGQGDSSNKLSLDRGESDEEGMATWIWVTLSIVAFVILLAVGAFFFLEFEEFEDEDPSLPGRRIVYVGKMLRDGSGAETFSCIFTAVID